MTAHLGSQCRLTIVGGGRDAWSVWGRGTQSTLRARGPCQTWSSGPSTSPLGVMHSSPLALTLGATLAGLSLTNAVRGGEPVTVYTVPPTWVEAHRMGRANVEAAKRDLGSNWQRWKSLNVHDLSYTLTQFTTGILLTDCDLAPVRVQIRHDKIVAAHYAKADGHCRLGDPIRKKDYSQEIATPEKLFTWIQDARLPAVDDRTNCGFKVTFDPRLGIPTDISGGCPDMADSYWHIELSDIEIGR